MDSLGTDFNALLTRGALVALLVAGVWAATVVASVAVEARTSGRLRFAHRTGCPPAVRVWLLGVFTVVLGGLAPAQASDQGTGHGTPPGTEVRTALDGLPTPDRAIDRRDRLRRRGTVDGVVVAPGDSLWRIAERRLPGDADPATVATAVASLYAANRTAIGPDPDRIVPGQHLDFPDLLTHPEEP
jgi:hypothetical protein